MIYMGAVAVADSICRLSCHLGDRLDWDACVGDLFNGGHMAFYSQYWMEHSSFVTLCALIDPFASVDTVY